MRIHKFLMVAPVLMMSSMAFAYPMVGDTVEYKGTYKLDPNPETELVVKKEVVLYNELEKEWLVKVDKTMNGSTTTEVDDVDDEDMMTPEKVQKVLTECVAKGGTLEDLTVPAGTISTCHMKMTCEEDSKEVWIGDVPFGVVKMIKHDMEDGKHKMLELQSFTLGQ
ncbi:hypothetical protein D3C87_102280 [compost metagenome]